MASTSSSFVPKGQQELLVRTPLTFGFAPTNYAPTSSLPVKEQQPPRDGGTSKNVNVPIRNKPHPDRVQHIKGILGSPICCVEDNTSDRRLFGPPSGQEFGPPYRPVGGTRYGSNRTKGLPAVGVVPVTYAWRDELEKKTHMAISRAMGHPPPSRGGVTTRSGLRMQQHGGQFDHIHDDQLLELLCKILQTDSIPKCQAWLASTSDTEKNIVLNMIRMAATGEMVANPSSTRPQTRELQYRYVWAPEQSHTTKAQNRRSNPTTYHDDETEFEFSYSARPREQHQAEGSTEPYETTLTLPEHGAKIQTARQFSNLASRLSSRSQKTRSLDLSEVTLGGGHQMQASSMAQRLPSARDQSRQHRSRSNSFSDMGPKPTGASSHRRMRSSSARATLPRSNYPENPTIPPVRVSVTKEKIRSDSGKARLRYTSHWET